MGNLQRWGSARGRKRYLNDFFPQYTSSYRFGFSVKAKALVSLIF